MHSSTPPSSDRPRVPPQLIGIIDDARREHIHTFTLEYSRGLVMASFSAGHHAAEIDFELEAGEEMLRFLRTAAPDTKAKRWAVRCTYHSETYNLVVERTNTSRKGPLHITWSIAADEKGT